MPPAGPSRPTRAAPGPTSPPRILTTADLGTDRRSRMHKRPPRDAVVGYYPRRAPTTRTTGSWAMSSGRHRSPWGPPRPISTISGIRATNAFAAASHQSCPCSSGAYPAGSSSRARTTARLHAFKTSDGSEAWSFIPPNLLSRLKLIAHRPTRRRSPTSISSTVRSRSPTPGSLRRRARDVEVGLRLADAPGLRRGAGRRRTNLWSSSTSCDSGFSQTYTATYPYYCGYYCLDVNTSAVGSPDPFMQWTPSLVGTGGSGSPPPRRPTWAPPGAR